MKNIHLYELKKYLIQKLNTIYIFLGEDDSLSKKSQDIIKIFALKKGFLNTVQIDIEKDKDWEKIVIFYKKRNLFFQKTILVVNFLIKNINSILIKKICRIFTLLNSDILIILKFNHLSISIKNSKFFNQFQENNNIIICDPPYNSHLILWIKYEIEERKIQIEDQACYLLYKYYEGNTLFILNVLDMVIIRYPNTYITCQMIKKIIINCIDYSSLNLINYIFQFKTKKAISILDFFSKKKYNPLILVRSLQKDLFTLIYMKRENNVNVNNYLKKYNICTIRHKFFIHAFQKIDYYNLLKAIQILVKIEINIKKNYYYSVWNQFQELTLILNN